MASSMIPFNSQAKQIISMINTQNFVGLSQNQLDRLTSLIDKGFVLVKNITQGSILDDKNYMGQEINVEVGLKGFPGITFAYKSNVGGSISRQRDESKLKQSGSSEFELRIKDHFLDEIELVYSLEETIISWVNKIRQLSFTQEITIDGVRQNISVLDLMGENVLVLFSSLAYNLYTITEGSSNTRKKLKANIYGDQEEFDQRLEQRLAKLRLPQLTYTSHRPPIPQKFTESSQVSNELRQAAQSPQFKASFAPSAPPATPRQSFESGRFESEMNRFSQRRLSQKSTQFPTSHPTQIPNRYAQWSPSTEFLHETPSRMNPQAQSFQPMKQVPDPSLIEWDAPPNFASDTPLMPHSTSRYCPP